MPSLIVKKRRFGHYRLLSPEQQRFVDEYLLDLNGAAAALRAGYRNFHSAYNLLNDPEIQEAIKERREFMGMRDTKTGAEFIINKLWDTATADARELIEIHRVPCRYCWGVNGQYQWTKTEMDRLVKAYEYGVAKNPFDALWPRGSADQAAYVAGEKGLPFDLALGGDGYTTNRDPNPTCTECGGVGLVLHFIGDTRKLSQQARQLYRGVRVGPKGGIEILMANQDTALGMLAKHYNVAIERKELLVRSVDPRKLSDDELLKAVSDLETIDAEYEELPPDLPVPSRPVLPPVDETGLSPAEITRAHRVRNLARARQMRPNGNKPRPKV
jgi:phage terminase small subunit